MKHLGYVQLVGGKKYFVSHKISVFVFYRYYFIFLFFYLFFVFNFTHRDDRSFLFRVYQKKVKKVRCAERGKEETLFYFLTLFLFLVFSVQNYCVRIQKYEGIFPRSLHLSPIPSFLTFFLFFFSQSGRFISQTHLTDTLTTANRMWDLESVDVR